jgi:C-terminal processing protease CtpA/Prc
MRSRLLLRRLILKYWNCAAYAIPRVNRAGSPQEYAAAVNQMLAVLDDKNTRAEIEMDPAPAPAPSRGARPSDYARITDGVLVLDAMTIAERWAKENSFFRSQVGSKIFPMLHQATAIVMDCRLKTDAGDEASPYAFDLFLRNALTALCDHAFPLGASRYRMHNGYAPQIGGTSGGYYSALVSTAPQVLAGQSKTPLRPLVFIINDKTPSLTPIPKFESDKDALEYQMTLREMVAEIQDSHGFVSGTTKYDQFIGGFAPPFQVGYVEKQTVVTTVMDAKAGVTAGDVVLAIDGVPVEKRRVELARFISASTRQALERRVHYQLLAGAKDSVVKLEVRRADGATHQIAAARTLSLNDPKYYMGSARTTPVMQVLPAGFGYVDLARLQLAQVDKMFETLKDTPAIIFDMRGYPNGTAWAIAPRLTEKTHVTAAQFSRPILEATNLSSSDYSGGTNVTFGQQIPERKGDVYKGKVVMLIDEDAISQAEHTRMFFEAATEITFIGTPTAGANGDVTNMVLPGNIRVNFSGHDVRHADGRQLQRVGIQPTIRVEPTVADIRSGRDAVLEAAIDYLQQKANK